MLLDLPFELQLIILGYVKAENHLDLCPLAQLVADRYNWTDTVTLIQPNDNNSNNIDYLTLALKRSISFDDDRKLPTKRLLSVSTNLELVQCILKHSHSTLEDIKLFMNKNHHKSIVHSLTSLPKLVHLTVRDPADDVSTIEHCHKLITTVLSRELITLDIPSLALNPFLMSATSQFYHLNYLSITIMTSTHIDDARLYWQRLKHLFPNLNHLTVTLPSQQNPSIFRALLTHVQLFPWIKRVTLLSKENPKHFLNRDDLRTSLLQLEGLNRITAGWDMIALN
ncbi:hypothetical protein K501DRAFT_312405 [Backusella circina FSU 941]|nr:hypothetical protein K501DRAFT_312405 [Backusella circina FSU 941]